MPDLVTLGSAAYNPYNDSFGRFAMQGLQMGLSLMEHNDNLAQRKSEQMQSMISEQTQNLFKGQEMQMRNKELNHRIENDLFNRILDTKRIGMAEKDLGLREKMQEHQINQDITVDNPYKKVQTESMQQSIDFNRDTWDDRVLASKQKVEADKLALEFNQKTQASRIASANLAPAQAAMQLQGAASELNFQAENPTYKSDMALADLEYKRSQTAANKGKEAYYSGGGAHADALKVTATEIRTLMSTNKDIFKELKTFTDKEARANADIATHQKALKENLDPATRKRKEDEVKRLQGEIFAGADRKRELEANAKAISILANRALEQFNERQIARGEKPQDYSGLSEEERAIKVLENDNVLNSQKTQDTGLTPGSAPNLSPADAAAKDNAAGKPIGTQSANPPTSRYGATDFSGVSSDSVKKNSKVSYPIHLQDATIRADAKRAGMKGPLSAWEIDQIRKYYIQTGKTGLQIQNEYDLEWNKPEPE